MSMTTPMPGNENPWRAQLSTMTMAEKQELFDAIWDDLSANPDGFVSPEWHFELLREREAAVKEGRTQFKDWEVAKREILEQIDRK